MTIKYIKEKSIEYSENYWTEFFKSNFGRKPTTKELEILISINKKNISSNQVHKAINKLLTNKHNSWYLEQWSRNKDALDTPGIFYRGKTISKKEEFERAWDIAKTLKVNGIKKGDTIPVCVSNVPYLISTLLGASMIGAKVVLFGVDFETDYIKEIINLCHTDFVITTDDIYDKLHSKLEQTGIKKEVVISLADDLPEQFPEYFEIVPEELYKFPNKVSHCKKIGEESGFEVLTIDEFLEAGRKSSLHIEDIIDQNPSIWDEFTITFSSGTTNTTRPKAICHNNLSYLMTMRFHDKDLSGLPENRDVVCLDLIPSTSDTAIKSVISDNLSRIIACEPIYTKESFIYSLIMNKAEFVDATKSFLVHWAKQVLYDPSFKGVDFSYFGLALAVGEGTTLNERKFIDKALKKAKAGNVFLKKLLGLPFPHTYLGAGGGRCESGGMFYKVLIGFYEKLAFFKGIELGDYGMEPAPYAAVAILDDNGQHLAANQIGELCQKGFCDTVRYALPDKAGKTIELPTRADSNGEIWPNYGCYAYKNELGNVVILGRKGTEFTLEDGTKVPEFILSRIIEIDSRNILSCEVVNYSNPHRKDIQNIPIANIELNPELSERAKTNNDQIQDVIDIIDAAQKRCEAVLPKSLTDKIVYRIIKTYPLTECGKRDNNEILTLGLNETYRLISVASTKVLCDAKSYLEKPFTSDKCYVLDKGLLEPKELFKNVQSNLMIKKAKKIVKVLKSN